jgi:hypothetical protein
MSLIFSNQAKTAVESIQHEFDLLVDRLQEKDDLIESLKCNEEVQLKLIKTLENEIERLKSIHIIPK